MNNFSRHDNSTSTDMADLYESTMMTKTTEQIIQENVQDGTLEEGWFDRAKMKGQQAVGAAKGLVQQGKGAIQNAAGNVVNKAGNMAAKGVQALGGTIDPSQNKIAQAGQNLQQQGQQNVQQGQQQGQQALVASAQKISTARVTELFNSLTKDLQSVGINVQFNPTEKQRILKHILNQIFTSSK